MRIGFIAAASAPPAKQLQASRRGEENPSRATLIIDARRGEKQGKIARGTLLWTPRKQGTENSEQRTENSEQRTENSEQRTENSEQRTENSEQRKENSEQEAVDEGLAVRQLLTDPRRARNCSAGLPAGCSVDLLVHACFS